MGQVQTLRPLLGVLFAAGMGILELDVVNAGHLFRGIAELGHLDGLADVFGAQNDPLGDGARQVRVLA